MKEIPSMPQKTVITTGTTAGVFDEKVKEVRTFCTLVQCKKGDMIEQSLEISDWKDGKEYIKKIKIPSVKAKS